MPKGMFLVGWDDTLGCIVKAKYPPEIDLDSNSVLQYMATIQALGKSPTIQVQDERQSTLIYGIPPSARKAGVGLNYTFMVLLLNENEVGKIKRYAILLSAEGKNIITAPRQEQESLFLKFAQQLFLPPARKVVFMGFTNAGKTSTKLFFFEKVRGDHLLTTPLEPTLGVDTMSYNLLDLNVSLSGVDTMSYNLLDLNVSLSGSDLTVFFFTALDWKQNPQKVRSYLEKLVGRGQKGEGSLTKIIAFCHKADLMTGKDADCKEEIISFTSTMYLPTYFTSIVNGGNEDFFQGLQILLREFSQYLDAIRKLLNPLIQQFEVQPLFLVDAGEHVMADYYTWDKGVLDTVHKVRAVYPGVFDTFATVFQHPPDTLVFSIPNKQDLIMCLGCSEIDPEFGHIFVQGNSLEALQKFHTAYQDLLASIK